MTRYYEYLASHILWLGWFHLGVRLVVCLFSVVGERAVLRFFHPISTLSLLFFIHCFFYPIVEHLTLDSGLRNATQLAGVKQSGLKVGSG